MPSAEGVTGASPKMRFVDLFAGIGGFRKGFEAHGDCVFTSEIDRFSRATYVANFGEESPVVGDIASVAPQDIPEFDILLAGFPCQPFSISGVSTRNSLGRPHGFADETQGTLFFYLAKILEHHRPRAFLFENVKGLVGHDNGRTFGIIRRTLLEDLGYGISWRVINAKSFVPQHRERVFIAGFREESGFDLDSVEIPDPDNGPKLGSILHPEDGSEEPESPFTEGPTGSVNSRYVLPARTWSWLQSHADKHRTEGHGFGFGLVDRDSVARTLSARYHKDGSEILVSRGIAIPRKLTPRECSRLMGFDGPRESRFIIPVSDTQSYRQFGNAVVVPVVQAVASSMALWLNGVRTPTKRMSQSVLPLGFHRKKPELELDP